MMLQAMQRARAILLFAVFVAACGEDPVDPGPGPKANQPAYDPLRHLVSNPVSTNAAGDGNSTAANEATAAYVSLPPGTYLNGVAADIRNAANGFEIRVTLENGGFDPVPVPAAVGDTLVISNADSSGTIIGLEQAIVPPETPPLIVRTRPGKGEVDVPFNLLNVTVVFSEPIDGSTVTAETIQLRQGGADGAQLAGAVALQANGLLATFVPAAPLEIGTEYTLVVTTGIRDLAGNALPNQEVVSFATLGIVAYVVVDRTRPGSCGCETGTRVDQNYVAVIETKTHTFVQTIDFGDASWSDVMFLPNRRFAYLSNGRTLSRGPGNRVVVIDAATHMPTGEISGLETVRYMTISLDGRFAYAINYQNGGDWDFVVVSTENHEIVERVSLGGPEWGHVMGLAVSPDGSIVYATAQRWPDGVSSSYFTIEVIDAATNSVVATRRLPGPASQVRFSPDGAFAYASNVRFDLQVWEDEVQSRIYVIDTADDDIVATIDTDRKGEEMLMTLDGAYLLVSSPAMGDVTVIETATNSVIDRIGVRPDAMLLSPDGSRLYVADVPAKSVWVIDVASMSIVTGIHIADLRLPSILAVTSDGAFLYVGGAGINTVAVIATETNTVIAEIDVGGPIDVGGRIKDIAITAGR